MSWDRLASPGDSLALIEQRIGEVECEGREQACTEVGFELSQGGMAPSSIEVVRQHLQRYFDNRAHEIAGRLWNRLNQARLASAAMTDCAAQAIVDQALTLARTHPQAPALDILDLAMTGQHCTTTKALRRISLAAGA